MPGYMEYQFWSPLLGCHAARISIFNEGGDEYYTIIPREEGKAHRQNRSDALDMLEDAIKEGMQPGEVVREGELSYGERA